MQIFFSILSTLATIIFMYQIFYLFVGLICKPKTFTKSEKHRYAVLISARNEETVIAHLINSIKSQTYPTELVDVYVVADNCNDKTAEIASKSGAIVYERFDKKHVGKGYALDHLLKKIKDTKGYDFYDGFFVFDADNILEPDYIDQMNKAFSSGYDIVTSYRNSKNYDTNWITAGYALWFLRESKYMNNSRQILNTSSIVAGTGFMFSKKILKDSDGWIWHLLSEDTQFTAHHIIEGYKAGYCHKAMFYDEQPDNFKLSWKQRLRWARGSLQIFRYYGWRLFKGVFKNKHKNRFSHLDQFFMTIPMIFMMMAAILGLIYSFIIAIPQGSAAIIESLLGMAGFVGGMYMTFFLMGILSIITEWKYINSTKFKKIFYLFTFPVFMLTWIPIGLVAVFKKVEWFPIQHNVVKDIDDIKNQK